MTTDPRAEALAQQLLDAQVRHHLDRLTGDRLDATVSALAENLLVAAEQQQIADLVDRAVVTDIVTRALQTVPGSAAVGGIIEMATTVALEGPAEPYPLGELIDRDRVEVLLDALFALNPVVERALERLVDSPLVGTMASRFMGRIVSEVVQANQAVADKVPGLGSLMSFGTSAASKVMGATTSQFEGLIGDTVGKGGTFAVRRLNRIVLETLRDPTTREAVLQVWDLAAQENVTGLGGQVKRDELDAVVDAVHDLAVSTLATEHAAQLATVLTDGFLDSFGGYTPTELLDELDLDRADLIADLVRAAPPVMDALRESGDLEKLLRARLEPFYASDEVRSLLA